LAIALDRGLARDLNGDLGAAQSDYRLAVQTLNSDEGRRRLALSLAIGRNRGGALSAIQPLLNRRDPAAQRARAFVLALTGDQAGAAQAIESVMPGGSARFAPFFSLLPHLSVPEKAAAVHLGMFPDNAAAKVAAARAAERQQQIASQIAPPVVGRAANSGAAATPTRPVASPPVRVALADPPPAAPQPSFSLPSQTAPASPSFSMPSANSPTPAGSDEAGDQVQLGADSPADESSEAEATSGNLSGIDKLLATIAEVPPASEPKVETEKPEPGATKKTVAKKTADKKAADKKAAAEKKAREEKLASERKAREEAARLGIKGTYWVQLAGGSNQDRMANEFKRLSTKAGKLLRSRAGYVTDGKSYYRLLVGPFDTKSDSQSFVNKLEKEGVDGFSWTRTPAQIKIEKLSSR
jgi:cell division septation protein DedD